MAALVFLYFVERRVSSGWPFAHALARLGRSSLFVYWIHVELVYGYVSWSIHRRLPLWGSALAYVAFTTFVYAVILFRDRVVDAWRRRKEQIAFQYKAEPV